jgi:hypothetical protein
MPSATPISSSSEKIELRKKPGQRIMSQMPAEEQAKLEHYLRETAKILYKNTDSDKLKDFESIEREVREQMMERVGPFIGEFFLAKVDTEEKHESEK